MRSVLVLVAAAGCNSVFGIEATGIQDASPMLGVDAAPPPVCPANGSAPMFRNELYQVPAKLCISYVVSEQAQTAAALCNSDVGMTPGTGKIDAELTAIVFATPMPITPEDVRLSPEGDRLLASGLDAAGYPRIEEYGLSGTTWEHKDEVTLSGAQYYLPFISPPSAGPDRRMIAVYYDTSQTQKTVELFHDSTGWGVKATLNYTALAVDNITQPSLSADGLRLVFISQIAAQTMVPPQLATGKDPAVVCCGGGSTYENDVYLATRASLDVPFNTAAVKIASVPSEVSWPYMTADCGRIYFSALNTVFYLKQ